MLFLEIHPFPRNFTHTRVYTHLLIEMGLRFVSEQALKTHDWIEIVWRDNAYNAKFRAELCLKHGFAIENKNF